MTEPCRMTRPLYIAYINETVSCHTDGADTGMLGTPPAAGTAAGPVCLDQGSGGCSRTTPCSASSADLITTTDISLPVPSFPTRPPARSERYPSLPTGMGVVGGSWESPRETLQEAQWRRENLRGGVADRCALLFCQNSATPPSPRPCLVKSSITGKAIPQHGCNVKQEKGEKARCLFFVVAFFAVL